MFKRITELEMLLSAVNISVYLSWIPGHCGIQANEEVDMLAIEPWPMIYSRTESLHPPLFHLLLLSAEIAKESWQRKWNHGFTGYYTRVPTVQQLVSNYCFQVVVTLVSVIAEYVVTLYDTMFMEDSFRTGTSESAWFALVASVNNLNKNLCGRDGRTICGPQCVPKSTSVTVTLAGPKRPITGRTDRQTDRQSATHYAAPS